MTTPSPADCQQEPGWRAYDVTPEDVAPLAERFGWHYEQAGADDCWIWGGPYYPATGYGKISRTSRLARGQHLLAHRVAWVLATGESLTDDLTIDHLCVNRTCVNPAHMEPVSLSVNLARRHTRIKAARAYPAVTDEELTAARASAKERVERLRREKITADRAAALAKRAEKVACDSCRREVRRDALLRHTASGCRPVGRPRKVAV